MAALFTLQLLPVCTYLPPAERENKNISVANEKVVQVANKIASG